jgi:prepilin-type N-terminal cleavage/methylation domain-containing protein
VSRRVGFTLVEIMIVVVIFGIMTLVAYPKVSTSLAKNDVRSSRTALANMFSKARAVAMQGGRTARVEIVGNNVFVTASPRQAAGAGDRDTVGGVQNLYGVYGVTLTSSRTVGSIDYDPRGFVPNLGQSLTLYVTRSGKQDSVKIDFLGRVTK